MRIGVFDSGLGGLLVARALIAALPQYDYVYLGDTKRVPYGNRSQAAVYEFTCQAAEYLFSQEDCKLIIVACNTASAEALRRIQREWLPVHFPDRRILGVIVPAVEALDEVSCSQPVGVLATTSTVNSGVYPIEIGKRYPEFTVIQQAAPLLVPLIEYEGLRWAQPIIDSYLMPFKEANVGAIMLACTHYAALKDMIKQSMGSDVILISQDEVVPPALADYLERHAEIREALGQNGSRSYVVTDLTDNLPHFNLKQEDLRQVSLT